MSAGFRIVGSIDRQETIAVGRAIHELRRLTKAHGKGRWRKRKGVAMIRLDDGSMRLAEFKIKRFVAES